MKNRYSIAGLCLVALVAVGGVFGFAHKLSKSGSGRPDVKIVLSGSVARAGKNVPVAEAGPVESGEVIDWAIVSKNGGNAEAVSHEAVAQIPAGTSYVAGSAKSEVSASVEFSIDNGKHYAEKPTVSTKQADGSMKDVPAPASMYTQIRYKWNSPLPAAGDRKATYQVGVK